MVSLLPTKFHETLFSSFRGVALTNCDEQTDGRTDGQDKNNMSPPVPQTVVKGKKSI